MEFLEWFMPTVWFVILALFLLLYVILDGFDLGVGILSLTSPSESQRTILMTSLGNVWDANETWLVLMGGALLITFTATFVSETLRSACLIPRSCPSSWCCRCWASP
ncbi:MAG: cytochrome d ubiquinol oxidase subunit II [Prochlorococcaceae cyanobacterium]